MLTSLPNSNAVAIIPTLIAAPANNLAMPVTEKTAAHMATKVAVNEVIVISDINFFIGFLMKTRLRKVLFFRSRVSSP